MFYKRYKGLKSGLKHNIETYDMYFPDVISYFQNKKIKVCNLITKKNYWDKPTYASMEICLDQLAIACRENKIKYLAMPKIGCGLDKLEWKKVKKMIQDRFKDTDIEIQIRYL